METQIEMLYEFQFEEEDTLGDNPEEDLELLLKSCKEKSDKIDLNKIKRAFEISYSVHGKPLRASGKPYYIHPIKVTLILLEEMSVTDNDILIASLLHDVIEDSIGDDNKQKIRNEIVSNFGFEILEMVESLTKIKHSRMSKNLDKAATYRKLFLALVKDVRVIIIKIADRLDNMRTLHYLRPEKQKEIAQETLNFYTPIAHRLGLTKIKMELEDRSLYFIDRKTYNDIKTALVSKRKAFIDYIRVFSEHIQNSLRAENVAHILTIVHKHIYEIYQMLQNGKTIDEIDNFYSMVITILSDNKFECYKTHGILVNAFNPVEQLVDYIAQPKINWYRSLITHLYGPDGKLIEVIIRTQEMDRAAEEGIFSAMAYKKGRIRALEISDEELEQWGQWMEDVIEEKGDEATQIIWDSIRNNLFDAEVVAFTDDGRMVLLPKRASLVDFAFHLSYETGLHIISGKVNGQLVPLNYEIKNGDKISVITSPNSFPKPEWQYFVISYKSEIALHNYFKQNPAEKKKKFEEQKDFIVRLRIEGEDRPGILQEITQAIDKANIQRISLDSSEHTFGGAISIKVPDNKHLNNIYLKLLNIKGIKTVMQIDESEN